MIEVEGEATLGRNFGWSHRETLSLRNIVNGGSAIIAANSLTCLVDVMATKKITFIERWVSEPTARGSKRCLVSVERIRLRSHGGVGFLIEGKVLRRPWRKQAMVGWAKIKMPSIGERNTLRSG